MSTQWLGLSTSAERQAALEELWQTLSHFPCSHEPSNLHGHCLLSPSVLCHLSRVSSRLARAMNSFSQLTEFYKEWHGLFIQGGLWVYKETSGRRQTLGLMKKWPIIVFQTSASRQFRGNLKRHYDRWDQVLSGCYGHNLLKVEGFYAWVYLTGSWWGPEHKW